MSARVARLVVALVVALTDGQHVAPIACGGVWCHARANLATNYYALDAGDWRSMIGRCTVTVNVRRRDSASIELDTCRRLAKAALVPDVARRRGLS